MLRLVSREARMEPCVFSFGSPNSVLKHIHMRLPSLWDCCTKKHKLTCCRFSGKSECLQKDPVQMLGLKLASHSALVMVQLGVSGE